LLGGEVSASGWDFGDGTVVSNRPYASHAWAAAGDFTVELRGYNESYPGGVTASVLVHVLATPVHYVALDNPGPVAPYNSWATAATNIQDAVDAAAAGGSVLVSNGVFQAGARAVFGMSNRVAVLKPLTLRSVNGPGATSIAGFQEPGTTNGPSAVRCVYLTSGTSMEGFTLTNGATQISEDEELNQSGGGVWCEPMSTTLSNCVLTGNSASRFGGGAFYGTLKNCALTGNSATSGGGADHASFNNCSLTANSAAYGGGASASTLDDCTLTANSAFAYYSSGGGAYDCTLNRCTLTTNSTDAYGGGARYSTLNHCTLIGNSVTGQGGGGAGGGAADCVLNNCTLMGNSCSQIGGGTCNGTLNNCTLEGNSAGYGGGAVSDNASPCILDNCILTRNFAGSGGGAGGCTLNNCALIGNVASIGGGGALNGTLNHCTVVGNSAVQSGGGVYNATLTNCIVYYNTVGASVGNYSGSALNHCCTTPISYSGEGNFTAEPLLAGNWHLNAASPCRGAATPASAIGLDLDDEPWADPPSIGCDEYRSGSATGALSAAIVVAYTNAAPGLALSFEGWIQGQVIASRWDFGDGTIVSNRPFTSHAWTTAGDYQVELRAYNDSNAGGVATNITLHIVANPVHYVALSSSNPLAPYTSWATAATNIQDAVNAAVPGGLVVVSNGVYQAGATAVDGLSNRVAVIKPLTIRSVSGRSARALARWCRIVC
ncbi:MAG: PKD domain-containing protein, partial [Verrucomicrobia bacterium]|nr:PKD domain-containing protein [Verrucomicrobiota bacterium]